MESVIIKNSRTNKGYVIYVSVEEAKRLYSDPAFAKATFEDIERKGYLYNMKPYYLNEKIINMEKTSLPVTEEISDDSNVEQAGTREMNNETEGFKWPHDAILLLINKYVEREKDFTEYWMTQKKIWSSIAAELNKHNYNVTGAQCLSKFSSLKRTYKRTKDHNSKFENGRRTWPYFSHMDSLLGSKPFMQPPWILTTGKRAIQEAGCSIDTAEKPVLKKMRQTSIVDQVLQHMKQTAEASEKRHRENMEMRIKFLDVFTEIINKFKNK